jgi:hypothetical protein
MLHDHEDGILSQQSHSRFPPHPLVTRNRGQSKPLTYKGRHPYIKKQIIINNCTQWCTTLSTYLSGVTAFCAGD